VAPESDLGLSVSVHSSEGVALIGAYGGVTQTKQSPAIPARFIQMAEVAMPRAIFAGIINLINGLRDPPLAAVVA